MQEKQMARKQMIAAILATDMEHHGDMLSDFTTAVQSLHDEHAANSTSFDAVFEVLKGSNTLSGAKLNPSQHTDLELIGKLFPNYLIPRVLIHSADVSNPAKAWVLAKIWADKVVQEFFVQGDLEKECGLPVTFDRETTTEAKIEHGFTLYIVKPLFTQVSSLLPLLSSSLSIKDNLERWK